MVESVSTQHRSNKQEIHRIYLGSLEINCSRKTIHLLASYPFWMYFQYYIIKGGGVFVQKEVLDKTIIRRTICVDSLKDHCVIRTHGRTKDLKLKRQTTEKLNFDG